MPLVTLMPLVLPMPCPPPGSFKDPSGGSYVGEWRQGVKHGAGLQTYNAEGTARYEGEWAEDLRQGQVRDARDLRASDARASDARARDASQPPHRP